MQTVCEQKLFKTTGMKTDFGPHPFAALKMDPAEVKLSVQLFVGGLAVSGLLLLAIHYLGL